MPHDLNDPQFPHGTTSGYRYGCRKWFPCPATPSCHKANLAGGKAWRDAKRRALPPEQRFALYRPGAPARHLRDLLNDGWTLNAIVKCSGLGESTVRRIRYQRGNVTKETAQRILMVTSDLLASLDGILIPVHCVRWRMRSIYALGYSYKYLARRMGISPVTLRRMLYGAKQRHVTAETYRRACTVFEDLGNALPPRGQNADSVRADAARRGWYTPEFYTLDGRLMDEVDWDNSMEERYANRTRLATLRLEVLWRSLRLLQGADTIATALDMGVAGADMVSQYRSDCGLVFQRPEFGSPFFEHETMPKPECAERAAVVLEVLRRWQDDPLGDPYHYCLELGMMTHKRWKLIKRRSQPTLVVAA